MRQGSSRLLFDERFFTDPAPRLLSLKYVCGQGACSGTDTYYIRQLGHAWGQTQIPLCSARQNQVLVSLNLSKGVVKAAPGCPASEAPPPARCQAGGGAPLPRSVSLKEPRVS